MALHVKQLHRQIAKIDQSYIQQRLIIVFRQDSIQISGTLRYASLDKLVIIIAGSGPTDRNCNSAGLNSNAFKMLADTLCQMGISSFRYDKRGIGESTKVGEEKCTLYDRVDDVNAVSNYFYR